MKLKYFSFLFVTLFFGPMPVSADSAVGQRQPVVLPTALDSTRTAELRREVEQGSAPLFLPMTFYRGPVQQAFSLQKGATSPLTAYVDSLLLSVYVNHPDLVEVSERQLDRISAPVKEREQDREPLESHPDIVDIVSPGGISEPEFTPQGLLIRRPNFWTFSGDYYLQFMQNYVSTNWYKGGESNYSMLGSAVMQANFNNKQKLRWDNKLEMRLGMQTSKGDSIHSLLTTEDLLRLTSKVGLQAHKRWYYTLQMIATTQFTHTYKANDPKVYASFFSPFTLNASLGMDYTIEAFHKKLTGTAHLAPIAVNYKFVNRGELATRYGIDAGKHSLWDYGSECTVDVKWLLSDRINWKSRLFAYTTYKRTELEWENTFSFQFNKWISSNLFIYPRFDDGVERIGEHSYWQLKEYLSIGFSYNF
ncbi:MAG: DUF3078 domain-containing protein [Prevotella sp.]|nr:DUF3078 domain-containing protein [Prevotella sp.]